MGTFLKNCYKRSEYISPAVTIYYHLAVTVAAFDVINKFQMLQVKLNENSSNAPNALFISTHKKSSWNQTGEFHRKNHWKVHQITISCVYYLYMFR